MTAIGSATIEPSGNTLTRMSTPHCFTARMARAKSACVKRAAVRLMASIQPDGQAGRGRSWLRTLRLPEFPEGPANEGNEADYPAADDGDECKADKSVHAASIGVSLAHVSFAFSMKSGFSL